MNKRELSSIVAERAGIPKGDAAKAVQAMIECIIETVQSGQRITLMGFGSFFYMNANLGHIMIRIQKK